MVAQLMGLIFALAATSRDIYVDGEYFRDKQGRVAIFRGVNLSGTGKLPPFRPVSDLAVLDPLPRWGVNVVRLPLMWEAIEPTAGHYDQGYLQYIRRLVDALAAKGIYTILDFHQDGLARNLLGGCGDGFPDWALSEEAKRDKPDHGPNCERWAMRLVSDNALQRAWMGFYNNERQARTRYVAMVSMVATLFQKSPMVLGYDLLNEPMGDEIRDLGPLYQELVEVINKADSQALFFVQPFVTVSMGLPSLLPKPADHRVVYAPHIYDPVVMGLGVWLGNGVDWRFAGIQDVIRTWRAPVFVGEYGAPVSTWRLGSYMDMFMRRMDEGFFSGTQWTYAHDWTPERKDGWNNEDLSIVDDKGALRSNFMLRPYAQRIAGRPISQRWDWGSESCKSTYVLIWEHKPGSLGTEIYVPLAEILGCGSFQIEVSQKELRCRLQRTMLQCQSEKSGRMQVRLSLQGQKVGSP